MKRILMIIILTALFALVPLGGQAAPIGEFSKVEGSVDITSPGQSARPVRAGDEVNVGDIVRAKSRSKAEVTFVDGSVIRIAQKSRVEIDEYVVDGETRSGVFNLFRGRVENIVKKAGGLFGFGKKNKYEVHTPTAVCGVRGTDYFSSFQRGTSNFVFKEGSGYGFNKNLPDQIMSVTAGQAMTIKGTDAPPMVRPATAAELQKLNAETAMNNGGDSDEGQGNDGSDEGVEAGDGGESPEDDGSGQGTTDEEGQGDSSSGDEGPGDDGGATDEGSGDQEPGDQGLSEGESGNYEGGESGEPGEAGPGDYSTGGETGGDPGPEDGEPGQYSTEGPYPSDGPTEGPYPSDGPTEGPYPSNEPSWVDGPDNPNYWPDDPNYWPDRPDDSNWDPQDPNDPRNWPKPPDVFKPPPPPPPIPKNILAFSVNSFGIGGTMVGDPWDGNQLKYPMTMAGDYYQTPPFMYMYEGIYGRLTSGTDALGNNGNPAYFYGSVAAAWVYDIAWSPPEMVDGMAVFFYVDDTGQGGFLVGNTFGTYYPDTMKWSANGFLESIMMAPSGITYGPITMSNMFTRELRFVSESGSGTCYDTSGNSLGTLTISSGLTAGNGIWDGLSGQDWGIFRGFMEGTHNISNHANVDGWFLSWQEEGVTLDTKTKKFDIYLAADGGVWSQYHEIDGRLSGGWVDIDEAVTGVLAGDLHGGYDPYSSWEAGGAGVWIETTDFFTKLGGNPTALDKLYIPRFSIGQTTLSQGAAANGLSNVTMNNVTFFSDTSGGRNPAIWATNSVTGNYSATPSGPVNLTGGGLTVSFNVTTWDSGNNHWAAAISGNGSWSGGGTITAGDNINMGGGAAGEIDQPAAGKFQGTGAGWAQNTH